MSGWIVVLQIINIVFLCGAVAVILMLYILPVQRMKRNAPDGKLLFASKKRYIAVLILSIFVCAIGAALIALTLLTPEKKSLSFGGAAWVVWLPLMYNGVVARTKDELLLCGISMKISDIKKIIFNDTGMGLYITVKRKNGRNVSAYTSREAKRFLNDLIAGLSSEKEDRTESL